MNFKKITALILIIISVNSLGVEAQVRTKSIKQEVIIEDFHFDENTKILFVQENENIEYIKLPDGNIVYDNKASITVSENGSYEFKIKLKKTKELVPYTKTISDVKKSYLITPSEKVILKLQSKDNLSGVDKMKFKNETNGTWTDYENYKINKEWTLDSKEGLKTVFVKYKDLAGNETTEIFDKIILDKSGPIISNFQINNGDPYTNKINVKLNLIATDNYSNIDKLLISNDNVNWTEKPYSNELDWTLDKVVGTKTVFIKSVDANGNIGQTVSDTIYLDTILPTGNITINNNNNITNSKNVELTLNFDDLHSKVKRVTIIEKDKHYTFPSVPSSPTKLNWTLSHGNTGKVTLEVEDNAGNIYRTDSNEITIATLEIVEFKLTNVINPSVFNENNPFKPIIWSFEPQPMKSGANISFDTKYSLELDENTTTEVTGNFTLDIIADGYNKTINQSYNSLEDNIFKATVKLPNDAPQGAKVYLTTDIKATLKKNEETIVNEAIFPGLSEKALIGIIGGNIKEDIIFNEIS